MRNPSGMRRWNSTDNGRDGREGEGEDRIGSFLYKRSSVITSRRSPSSDFVPRNIQLYNNLKAKARLGAGRISFLPRPYFATVLLPHAVSSLSSIIASSYISPTCARVRVDGIFLSPSEIECTTRNVHLSRSHALSRHLVSIRETVIRPQCGRLHYHACPRRFFKRSIPTSGVPRRNRCFSNRPFLYHLYRRPMLQVRSMGDPSVRDGTFFPVVHPHRNAN